MGECRDTGRVEALVARAEQLAVSPHAPIRAAAVAEAGWIKAVLLESGVAPQADDLIRRCDALAHASEKLPTSQA